MSTKLIKNLSIKSFTIFSITFLFILLLPIENIYGQKKVKREDIKDICKNVPLSERPRLTVSNFKIEARKARGRFGTELKSMLTNAISGTGCFDVLETVGELSDELAEIDFGKSTDSDGSGAIGGQMLGSRLVMTGTITEYDTKKVHILGVGSEKAHLGFILKIVDIQTRRIVWNESFETKVTRPQVRVLRTDLMAFGSQAMEDAAEKAIIKATSALSKDKNMLLEYKEDSSEDTGGARSQIVLNNVDFGSLMKIEKYLKSYSGIENVSKKMDGKTAYLEVAHSVSLDQIAGSLMEGAAGISLDITGFGDNKIEATVQ